MANKEEIWVTEGGTGIEVGSMSEEHCRNTLRMLIRQIRIGSDSLKYHHCRINEYLGNDVNSGYLNDWKKDKREAIRDHSRQVSRTVARLIEQGSRSKAI